jgi:thiol:disulfide interchange protein DsbD
MRLWLGAIMWLLLGAGGGFAAESTGFHSTRVTATLVSEADSVAPGKPLRVALRLMMAPGWHTYWKNPGDAGVAPDLSFTLPQGVTASAPAWPAPMREQEGPLLTFGNEGDVLLPVTLTGASGALSVRLHAEWLICNKICVPEQGDFRLDLPAGDGAPGAQAGLFARAEAHEPRPSPWPASVAPDGTLSVRGLTAAKEAWFAAESPDQIEASSQTGVVGPEGLVLRLRRGSQFKPSAPLTGVLMVRDAGGQVSALRLTASPGPGIAVTSEPDGLRLLGLALLGGLVLNLMPCVFPVLAIKTVGLAGLAGAHRRAAALHAASYTGGTLVAFGGLGGLLLMLRAAGASVGWGFQFQSAAYVTATAWVLFLVGLNLSGVYRIGGGRLLGAGDGLASRAGHAGSFFTGLLAVLVATPCTAPFMAAAIAGALAAPPLLGMAVFLAMGLGLAAPYAVVALVPGLARALPRPGRWMVVLQQALAFPMYAAAAWLVWVMSQQAGPSGVEAALAGLVMLGVGAWSFGLAQTLDGRGQRLARVVAAASVLGMITVLPGLGAGIAGKAQAANGAEPFSAARLAELRAERRPVFVDLTAAWCVTCLVNERLALAPAAVRRAFADRHVAYLQGDWTRQDPGITDFLRKLGRDGVPLYVFYPGNGAEPRVLPQILTESIVLDTIASPPG